MTRLRKIDPEALEREYVFGQDSLQDLAEKHGLSKSAVAGYASRGNWFEKRQQFKGALLDQVRAAIAEDWATFEAELRKRMLEAATQSLDAYVQALAEGKIELTGKDAIAWIGLIRSIVDELRPLEEDQPGEDLDPELAREILAKVDTLVS
jgi:hypothetical protein